jgi:hypothetical protein
VSDDLRKALERTGQTRAHVSRKTGIPESVLSRFAYGQPLRGENLDKLAAYLGLRLVAKKSGRGTQKGR